MRRPARTRRPMQVPVPVSGRKKRICISMVTAVDR